VSELGQIETYVKKYTGITIDSTKLATAENRMHGQIVNTVVDIIAAENYMIRSVASMRGIAKKVEEYVYAKPGQSVKMLGPWGEVSGSEAAQMDARIVTFHERVRRLQMLMHLWKQEQGL
jgi:hypothetical protein